MSHDDLSGLANVEAAKDVATVFHGRRATANHTEGNAAAIQSCVVGSEVAIFASAARVLGHGSKSVQAAPACLETNRA